MSVEADTETRVRRATARGLSEQQARARIAAQSSAALRRATADIVISNDGDLESFRLQADELIERLRERAVSVE